MVIILLAILATAFTVGTGDWLGIEPCKDDIDCVADLLNINVSNPEDCNGYFICNGQWLYPKQCPAGLRFDQNYLVCEVGASCHSSCLPEEVSNYQDHIFRMSAHPTIVSETSSAPPSSSSDHTSGTSLLSTTETKTSRQMPLSSLTNSKSSATQTTSTPSSSAYTANNIYSEKPSTAQSSREPTIRTSSLLTAETGTSLQTSFLTSAKLNMIDTTSLPPITSATSAWSSSSPSSTQMFQSSPSSPDISTAQSTSSIKSETPCATSPIPTQSPSTRQPDAPTTVTTSNLAFSTASETSHYSRESTSLESTAASFTTSNFIRPNETTSRQITTTTKTPVEARPSTTEIATTVTATTTTTTTKGDSPSTVTSAAVISTTPARSSSSSFSPSTSSSTSSLFSSSLSSRYPSSLSSWSSRLLSTSHSSSSSSTKAKISPTTVTTTIATIPISSATTSSMTQTTKPRPSTSSEKVTTSNRSPVATTPTTATSKAVTSQTTGLTTSLAPNTSLPTYSTEITKITNPESFTSSIADNRQPTSAGETSQRTTSAGETSQRMTSDGQTSQWMTSDGKTSRRTISAGTTSQRTTISKTSQRTTYAGETSQRTTSEALSTEGDRTLTTAFQPDLSTLCNRQLPCMDGDRFGDVADCSRYFKCDTFLGKKYWFPMACPSGQLYDPVEQNCTTDNYGRCLKNICSFKFDHVLANVTWPALSNRPLSFLCSFRLIFVVQPISVNSISWTLNGYAVTSSNTDQRIQVKVSVDGGFYNSTLSLNPAMTRDSGFVECIVEYGNGQTSRQTETFQVLPTPSVDLYPLKEVVLRNESVALHCKAYYDDPSISGSNSNDAFGGLDVVWYKDNQKIDFTNDTDCTVNGVFNVSVLTCKLVNDTSFFCRTKFSYGFIDSQPSSIEVVQDNAFTCKSEVKENITWPQTLGNTSSMVSCNPSSVGSATRRCSDGSGWENPNTDGCIDKDLAMALLQARDVRQGVSINSSNATESIAVTVISFLSRSESGLTFSNFNTSLAILQELASIHSTAWNITKPSPTEIKSVLMSASWLLNSTNDQQWRKLIMSDAFGAVPVMDVVNIYGKKWAQGLSPGNSEILNLDYLTVATSCVYRNQTQTMTFPQKTFAQPNEDEWIRMSEDSIFFQNPIHFQNGNGSPLYYISSSYYRNLDSYLPSPGPNAGTLSNTTLGSRIISLTVDGLPSSSNLSIPVRIVLENTATPDGNITRSCVFWNSASMPSGSWSDVGCRRVTSDEPSELTVCECDHLTNFAILFSSSPANDVALSIISSIGCVISIVSLILTLLLFTVRWKEIRSHHIVVLINLCIALIIANIIFLAGVNRTSNKDACTAIAALLHYFFLSAFFMMLVEGIQLLLYIACPLHVHRKRETTLLLVSAWVLPMVVVGVSLGITKTEGYGDTETCWLSVKNGLLWAFVGPALAIILVNFVIFVIVLVYIARAKRAVKRTRKQRIWATAWNVFMITPVLGVSWVFGVFSVNEELVVFQYIFAIFNSLQGFFIFLFHGLCYRKPGDKSEDISCKTEEEPQPQQRRPSYVRRPSRNKMAHIENQKRRLRRHAINWVAIAAAAVASSADNLDLREFDEDSMSGGSRDESHVYYDEETFSRSLQPPSDVNSVRSGSPNTASTNRTDLLF